MKQHSIILSLLFFSLFNSLNGQKTMLCGADERHENPIVLNNSDIDRIENKLFSRSSILDTIPTQIHIVRYSNGSGTISTGQVDDAIDSLNHYFETIDLYFSYCNLSFNYIDNDALVNYHNGTQRATLHSDNNVAAFNIYFIEGAVTSSGGAPVCGLGSLSGGGTTPSIIISNASACMNDMSRVGVHETGHYFGLYHTHGKYGQVPPDYNNLPPMTFGFPTEVAYEGAVRYHNENLDDNNSGIFDCYETGDHICDTPAQPMMQGQVSNCNYIGTSTDYFGDTYNPNVGNVMSYGPNCDHYFTTGQYVRARYIFETETTSLHCRCSDKTYTITSTEDSGYGTLRSAINCINGSTQDGYHNINFDIPGNGPHIISLESLMPNIDKDSVIIDATTQPTYYPGEIILDGDNMISRGLFLYFNRDDIEIYGLQFQNFTGTALQVTAADHTKIGDTNKGNIFKWNQTGILAQCTDCVFAGNTFEANEDGMNIFNNNSLTFHENVFLCNQRAFFYSSPPTPNPEITVANATIIEGTSGINNTVYIYKSDVCNYTCEPNEMIGSTVADGAGAWTFSPGTGIFNAGDRVLVLADDGVGTSDASDCEDIFTYTNYDCANATTLTSDGFYFTHGPDQGNGANNSTATHSVWYEFIPPTDGLVDIFSCYSIVNTNLYVYSGNCGNLTLLDQSDDDCENWYGSNWTISSEVTNVSVTMGVPIYIEWDDKWSTAGFDFTIIHCPSNYAGSNQLTGTQITSEIFDTDGIINSDQASVEIQPK